MFLLRQENQILKDKLHASADAQETEENDGKFKPEVLMHSGKSSASPTSPDTTTALLALTRKLQDASAAYEKVKREMSALKKVLPCLVCQCVCAFSQFLC